MRDIKVLTAEQVRLSAAADAAQASAAAATRVIQRDKAALDKIVLAQRSKMAKLRSLQVAEVEKAGPIASLLVGARTPAAKAAAQRLRDALSVRLGRHHRDRQAVHQRRDRLPQRHDPAERAVPDLAAPPVRASPPPPPPASTR